MSPLGSAGCGHLAPPSCHPGGNRAGLLHLPPQAGSAPSDHDTHRPSAKDSRDRKLVAVGRFYILSRQLFKVIELLPPDDSHARGVSQDLGNTRSPGTLAQAGPQAGSAVEGAGGRAPPSTPAALRHSGEFPAPAQQAWPHRSHELHEHSGRCLH